MLLDHLIDGASARAGYKFRPMVELCVSILDDAVRVLIDAKAVILKKPRTRVLHIQETLDWFKCEGEWVKLKEGYVFSFPSICEILGIDPESVLRILDEEGLLHFKIANIAIMDRNNVVRVYPGRDSEHYRVKRAAATT